MLQSGAAQDLSRQHMLQSGMIQDLRRQPNLQSGLIQDLSRQPGCNQVRPKISDAAPVALHLCSRSAQELLIQSGVVQEHSGMSILRLMNWRAVDKFINGNSHLLLRPLNIDFVALFFLKDRGKISPPILWCCFGLVEIFNDISSLWQDKLGIKVIHCIEIRDTS